MRFAFRRKLTHKQFVTELFLDLLRIINEKWFIVHIKNKSGFVSKIVLFDFVQYLQRQTLDIFRRVRTGRRHRLGQNGRRA